MKKVYLNIFLGEDAGASNLGLHMILKYQLPPVPRDPLNDKLLEEATSNSVAGSKV